MQAPSKSRASTVSASAVAAPEALPTVVRMLVALLATVTLLFMFRPTVVHAQTTAPKPPAAKPVEAGHPEAKAAAPAATTTGSAHGALAEQTAGKNDAAPKEPVKAAPRAVRPAAARTAAAPAAAAPAKVEVTAEPKHAVAHEAAPSVATTTADPVEEVDNETRATFSANGVMATRVWGPSGSAMRNARGAEPTTVFISHALDAAQADVEVEALLPVKSIRARTGEYAGAPFAVSPQTLLASGFIGVPVAQPTGIVGRATAVVTRTEQTPKRLLLLDETEITLPAGSDATVGSRFVTVDANRLVKSTVQVAVPTGVLEIVKVEAGRPAIARVVQQTGAIQNGQRLLPLEGAPVASDLTVTPVKRLSNAPESEVIWINGDGLLPSLQSFLVLGAGEREGVKAGDQFALVKRRGLGPDAIEDRVALVRVVRVTAFGSSAIVVRQDQPGIGVGTAARLVGRVQ